jgi:hypothetical protein
LYACEIKGIEHEDFNPFGENLVDNIVSRWVDFEEGEASGSPSNDQYCVLSKVVCCGVICYRSKYYFDISLNKSAKNVNTFATPKLVF